MNREKMIIDNLPLINYIINQMGLQKYRDDLFSIGLIGLIKGVDNYNHDKYKSSTYLYLSIKHEIYLNLRKKKVDTVSINSPIEGKLILEDTLTDDYDFTKDIENKDLLNKIYANLDKLKQRDKEILIKYYGLFNSRVHRQDELSDLYRMSQANICRIIQKSVKTLKELIRV